jgi:NAD(P)-dependent dehydrogenase (short-subunit alcohol dehydrogenase family)
VSERSPLLGRVAVVTGASRGIGRALALSVARLGADVVVTGRTVAPRPDIEGSLDGTKAEVEALGRRCVAVGADLTDAAEVERLAKVTLDELGRVDVVVNNAAAMVPEMYDGLLEMTPESWRYQIELNLTVPWLVTKTFVPLMEPDGGIVVNMTSMAGAPAAPGTVPPGARVGAAYAASKVALNRLTSDLAAELAGRHIAVVALHPGMTKTENGTRLGALGGFRVDLGHDVDVAVEAFERIVTAADPMAHSGAVVLATDLAGLARA